MANGEHPKESAVLTKLSTNSNEEIKAYGEISSLYQAVECYFQAKGLANWAESDVNYACYLVSHYLKRRKSEEVFFYWYYNKAIKFEGIPNDIRKEIIQNDPFTVKDLTMNYDAAVIYKAGNLVNYLAGPITNWENQYREPQSPLFLLCLFESFGEGRFESFPPTGFITLGGPLKISVASMSMHIELGEIVSSDDKTIIAQAKENMQRNFFFFQWLDSVIMNEKGSIFFGHDTIEYDAIGNIFVHNNRSPRKEKPYFSLSSGFAEIEPIGFNDVRILFKLKYMM